MAFTAQDRVKVINQNHAFRNHLGVVTAVDNDNVLVQIDGHRAERPTLFKTSDLRESTQPSPIINADS